MQININIEKKGDIDRRNKKRGRQEEKFGMKGLRAKK